VVAVVQDSEKSLQVISVVPKKIPGGRGRSLDVVAVVSDVPGGSRRSPEAVAVVPDVPALAQDRWKLSRRS